MNGLQLSSMECSDMLDVVHYIFEEDYTNILSGEHVEAKEKVRTILYRDFYNTHYKYASSSKSSYIDDKIASEELTREDISDITAFDPKKAPVKPYMPPTEVDETLANPFGRVIDSPLG